MYNALGIKTDYSILKSLIKIPDLISFAVEKNINTLGILDDNLFSSIEFYDKCIKNNIKPIIGLDIKLNGLHIYLYARDYEGYKTLLKINTIIQQRNISVADLKINNYKTIVVIPFESIEIYDSLKTDFNDIYLSYQNEYEKKNITIISKNVIPLNIVRAFSDDDIKYLKILDKIRDDNEEINKVNCYFSKINNNEIKDFISSINIEIDKSTRYIPHYSNDIKDSFIYLKELCKKGLSKRLNGNITPKYQERLNYELSVIKDMGFVDYFLIVYDYVKFAKKNNIMVGSGRGSAAGSLVSYSIGITNIDPIKYNLLFERFLNPGRISMPDIDVDFEDAKREQVVNYVKEKYGNDKVAPIMTFGTLSARQVLKDVAKALEKENHINELTKLIDSKKSLKSNIDNNEVKKILNIYSELKEIYNISYKLEGLKRHISTHAAGVVICSKSLDDIIPIFYNEGNLLTGVTMNYLEELGILKMDFLAITNLTMVHNILDLINNEINLSEIPLDDPKVYEMFSNGSTDGIFQFESSGMKNFLKKLKPKKFSDIYAALALFRPGPMGNIDKFIARKNGKEKIDYIDPTLEEILKETYGIIVYQEQIMHILVKMANYTFAEADNIRKAMSKKKEDIILKEKEVFISKSIANGYTKDKATEVYEMILKFANYGFNKAHSVSYAYLGYQMAYLKVHYPVYFVANLLNMHINDEKKTEEYLALAKRYGVYILKPCINLSVKNYKIGNKKIRLPLSIIKSIGSEKESIILEERNNGEYKDYFDFVARTYSKGINKKVLESLILAGALDNFKINRATLINNINNAIRYSELKETLDESLIEKPILEEIEDFSQNELTAQEYNSYGFYISNHPSSKYVTKDIVKLSQISQFFDKFIKTVVIINSIREIKTKKGSNMAFLECSDETGTLEYVIFSSDQQQLKGIKKNDLVVINGKVARRYDKYQINISKISKI